MTLVRYPLPHWPEQLDAHDRCLERLDDHLDADALQARREEIDRIAERHHPRGGPEPELAIIPGAQATPAANAHGGDGGRTVGSIPATGATLTDDQTLAGGSFWLSLLALAAAVVTICVLGVLVHVLSR